MSEHNFADMFAEMRRIETQVAQEQTGLAGWEYRDLPQMTPEFFDRFLGIVGVRNVTWITYAERQWPDGGRTKRGQVMISPDGMARIAAYNASGMEARRAETAKTGSVHDSPVPEGQTPNPHHPKDIA